MVQLGSGRIGRLGQFSVSGNSGIPGSYREAVAPRFGTVGFDLKIQALAIGELVRFVFRLCGAALVSVSMIRSPVPAIPGF